MGRGECGEQAVPLVAVVVTVSLSKQGRGAKTVVVGDKESACDLCLTGKFSF